MRKTLIVSLVAAAFASAASAQTTPATLRLTVDDAVKMALDENVVQPQVKVIPYRVTD